MTIPVHNCQHYTSESTPHEKIFLNFFNEGHITAMCCQLTQQLRRKTQSMWDERNTRSGAVFDKSFIVSKEINLKNHSQDISINIYQTDSRIDFLGAEDAHPIQFEKKAHQVCSFENLWKLLLISWKTKMGWWCKRLRNV